MESGVEQLELLPEDHRQSLFFTHTETGELTLAMCLRLDNLLDAFNKLQSGHKMHDQILESLNSVGVITKLGHQEHMLYRNHSNIPKYFLYLCLIPDPFSDASDVELTNLFHAHLRQNVATAELTTRFLDDPLGD